MARDVVDDRLIGALHVRALTRAGLHHDAHASHTVVQTGTVAGLLDGRYGGNVRLDELLEHGDLGIGTVEHLDGELVVLDGEAWAVRGNGRVDALPGSTPTPFAVVARFEPSATRRLAGPLPFERLTNELDSLTTREEPVVALRVDGMFRDLRLRSVRRQHRPYPPLRDVVAHQTEWELAGPAIAGSVVGFRFPAAASGIEVAGYHLHFLADDRSAGGHVLDLVLLDGVARVDGAHELHVEVPEGLGLGDPGAFAGEIAAVEGGAGGPHPDGELG